MHEEISCHVFQRESAKNGSLNRANGFLASESGSVKKNLHAISLTHIESIDTDRDFIDKPKDCEIYITDKGIYYLTHKGTPEEDLFLQEQMEKLQLPCLVP